MKSFYKFINEKYDPAKIRNGYIRNDYRDIPFSADEYNNLKNRYYFDKRNIKLHTSGKDIRWDDDTYKDFKYFKDIPSDYNDIVDIFKIKKYLDSLSIDEHRLKFCDF